MRARPFVALGRSRSQQQSTRAVAAGWPVAVRRLRMDATPAPPSAAAPVSLFEHLPPAVRAWLLEHRLTAAFYDAAATLPRYLRLNPRSAAPLADIRVSFAPSDLVASPIPSVYSVSGTTSLSSNPFYRSGALYGIDLASAAACVSLLSDAADEAEGGRRHVLDLCAAPGAKLCLLHDLLAGDHATVQRREWSVTGVDASLDRLAVTRALLHKYQITDQRVRVFCGDGTKFCVRPSVLPGNCASVRHVIVRLNEDGSAGRPALTKKQKRVERRHNRKQADSDRKRKWRRLHEPGADELGAVDHEPVQEPGCDSEEVAEGYDRVLVDAECSHDGSIKHMVKLAAHAAPHAPASFLDADRLASLSALQRALLENGFRQLRAGGVLVFSTCSLLREQNEDIVEWLLRTHPHDAVLMPVLDDCTGIRHREVLEGDGDEESEATLRWRRGLPFEHLPGVAQQCIRLDPLTSRTSGLFLARIRKRPAPHTPAPPL